LGHPNLWRWTYHQWAPNCTPKYGQNMGPGSWFPKDISDIFDFPDFDEVPCIQKSTGNEWYEIYTPNPLSHLAICGRLGRDRGLLDISSYLIVQYPPKKKQKVQCSIDQAFTKKASDCTIFRHHNLGTTKMTYFRYVFLCILLQRSTAKMGVFTPRGHTHLLSAFTSFTTTIWLVTLSSLAATPCCGL